MIWITKTDNVVVSEELKHKVTAGEEKNQALW